MGAEVTIISLRGTLSKTAINDMKDESGSDFAPILTDTKYFIVRKIDYWALRV